MGAITKDPDFLLIDLFCGAGGTTTGAENSGVCKVISAINHDQLAIESHAANHQDVLHMTEDILVADLSGIIAKANNIADIYMRMLKVIELKRIQGFPDEYILKGPLNEQKKFIGNSVETGVVSAWLAAIATQKNVHLNSLKL